MRKILIIVGIVVFFFVLLGLVVIKLFPDRGTPTASKSASQSAFEPAIVAQKLNEESSADTVAKECISWYLRYHDFATDIYNQQLSAEPAAQQCFTAQFMESWQTRVTTSEIDPVLLTGNPYLSWFNSIQAQVVSQLSQTSNVDVVLGAGEEAQRLSLTLRRSDRGWLIDSIL